MVKNYREEIITKRANEFWLEEGCPDGKAEEHWFKACEEFEYDRQKEFIKGVDKFVKNYDNKIKSNVKNVLTKLFKK